MVLTSGDNVCLGKFSNQKISAVRFVPGRKFAQSDEPGHGLAFVTGSWEDDLNSLCLWRSDDQKGAVRLAKLDHAKDGDVNKIEFIRDDLFAVISSSGSVNVVQIENSASLRNVSSWSQLHDGSGNDVSVHGENILSVGDDGKIFLLHPKKSRPLRAYEKADSCCLTAVKFINEDEVIAANMRGQLKLLDLRRKDEKPTQTFIADSGDQVGVTCLDKHPSQNHIVCCGTQSGRLQFWDLRNVRHPMTVMKGHDLAVNEVRFHEQQPNNLFSCSETGEVWHWKDASGVDAFSSNRLGSQGGMGGISQQQQQQQQQLEELSATTWYTNDAVKHRVQTKHLLPKQSLPLNSLDISGESLITGGDNEAFYLFKRVV